MARSHEWKLRTASDFGETYTEFIWDCHRCGWKITTYTQGSVGTHGAYAFLPNAKEVRPEVADCDQEVFKQIHDS